VRLGDDCGMGSSFLVVQLSDPHIGADWADGDPVAGLAAAVESVRAMWPQQDALLVTGDIADRATDAEYEQVRQLLAPLRAPTYVLAGNHDDRGALRRHFGLSGAAAGPVCYSVDLGPLRLVVLDSTLPGEDPGALDDERLAWLEGVLAASPEQPTLIEGVRGAAARAWPRRPSPDPRYLHRRRYPTPMQIRSLRAGPAADDRAGRVGVRHPARRVGGSR